MCNEFYTNDFQVVWYISSRFCLTQSRVVILIKLCKQQYHVQHFETLFSKTAVLLQLLMGHCEELCKDIFVTNLWACCNTLKIKKFYSIFACFVQTFLLLLNMLKIFSFLMYCTVNLICHHLEHKMCIQNICITVYKKRIMWSVHCFLNWKSFCFKS